MRLQGKRVAVLAENLYEDLELWYPLTRMREEGAEVSVIAPRAGETYTSKHGYPVKSDMAAEAVDASRFDAVIIPGGYSPDLMRRNPAMVRLVRQADQQGKVVAAICHAGWMLASAGILRGRTVTSFSAIKDDVINAGARWLDQEVVRDGNLVTSRFPADLPAFCREIILALETGTQPVSLHTADVLSEMRGTD